MILWLAIIVLVVLPVAAAVLCTFFLDPAEAYDEYCPEQHSRPGGGGDPDTVEHLQKDQQEEDTANEYKLALAGATKSSPDPGNADGCGTDGSVRTNATSLELSFSESSSPALCMRVRRFTQDRVRLAGEVFNGGGR